MRLNLQEHNIEVLDVTVDEVQRFLDDDDEVLVHMLSESGALKQLKTDVATGKYNEAYLVLRIKKE